MKKNNIPISIIVPAYNEQGNIDNALNNLVGELKNITNNYEILVVNDGSTDATVKNVKKLMKKNRNIKLIDRRINKGFGYTVKEGITHANKEYITQFHGDNDSSSSFIKVLVNSLHKADIISTYIQDDTRRSLPRRFMSRIFIILMNTLFGMNLRYHNGAFFCKTKLLQNLDLTSTGFAIYAESKARLVKKGYTITEIPFDHTGRKSGNSKAVSIKSFMETIRTLFSLIKDIYISGEK